MPDHPKLPVPVAPATGALSLLGIAVAVLAAWRLRHLLGKRESTAAALLCAPDLPPTALPVPAGAARPERRGPGRPANVVRPAFPYRTGGPLAVPEGPAALVPFPAVKLPGTGPTPAGDEWEAF